MRGSRSSTRPGGLERPPWRGRPGWRGLAALLGTTGVLHFAAPATFEAVVPRAMGDPRPWVAWSGVAELACAAALVRRRTRALAGWASAALFVAVYPANVSMAVRALRSPRAGAGRRAATLVRLPLQAPLVWWAVAVARSAAPRAAPTGPPDPRPEPAPATTRATEAR